MKPPRALVIVAFMLCVIFLGILTVFRVISVPYERDEISWYFHTKFFDEAFIYRRPFSSLWDGYESFDHPPVSKYIYGAYVYLRNSNYATGRQVLEQEYGRWNMYYSIKSNEDIVFTEFASILHELRTVNIVFTLLTLVEIFLLIYFISRSYLLSLVLCAILSTNTLFVGSMAVITSDSHSLFFSLLAVIFYIRSMRSKQRWWLIGASVATALAVGSKLTGVFVFLSVILNEMFGLAYLVRTNRKILQRIAQYVATSLIFWVIINPALYKSPLVNSWKYFSFRNFQSANIARFIPEVALDTPIIRAKAAVCTILFRSCSSHSAEGSLTQNNLLNMFMLVLGITYCWQAVQKRKREIIFLMLLGYCISAGYLVFLSNYSPRYFVFLQVIVFSVQLLGFGSLVQLIKEKLTVRNKFRSLHK